MPPTYRFRDPNATFTDITDYFRLYTLDVTMNAEEGSVGASVIVAEDPDALFDIVGHRQVQVREDTATGSNTLIYAGYTAERKISRGDFHRVQDGRIWEIALTDINTVLSRRIFDLNNANRPAETDVARIQWLLGVSESSLIDDSRYVSTDNAVAMDAVDYRGQTVADLINDCAQQSGKNWFVWYAEDVEQFSLWYDFASSENYSSPLRLSNLLTEVDNTWTFAISTDTELTRDPSRVYSGIYLPYDGGIVYTQSDTTADDFARRDAAMPSLNVKSVAKAEARAARYLADLDTEEDVITTTVVLPAEKVNFLMQGMRVQFQASHLPGYSEFRWLRVLSRTVRHLSETDEQTYAVTLELSAGDVVETVPTPEASDAYAILYYSLNTHNLNWARSDDVVWGSTGDAPASGYPASPKQGLVEYVSSVYAAGTKFDGFEITGTGTLSELYAKCTGTEVYSAGSLIATIEIQKNGVTVATNSVTKFLAIGGAWNWSVETTGSGVAVVPGDIISVHFAGTLAASGRWPKIPSGSGSQGLQFYIVGSLA